MSRSTHRAKMRPAMDKALIEAHELGQETRPYQGSFRGSPMARPGDFPMHFPDIKARGVSYTCTLISR